MCYCQDPSPGDQNAAADVSAGLALQGALPRPPARAAGPAPEDPLAHASSGAAAAVCGEQSALVRAAGAARTAPSAGKVRTEGC